jgi:hypothetical protein
MKTFLIIFFFLIIKSNGSIAQADSAHLYILPYVFSDSLERYISKNKLDSAHNTHFIYLDKINEKEYLGCFIKRGLGSKTHEIFEYLIRTSKREALIGKMKIPVINSMDFEFSGFNYRIRSDGLLITRKYSFTFDGFQIIFEMRP